MVGRQPEGALDARSRAVLAGSWPDVHICQYGAGEAGRARVARCGHWVHSQERCTLGRHRARRRATRDDGIHCCAGWVNRGGRRWHRPPRTKVPGVIENGTVVVERNRITAIGPSGSVNVPAGGDAHQCRRQDDYPGLIDVHAHVGGEGDGILAQTSWPLAANLAFGVTTSHDPSNDTETVFTNIELVRTGAKLGPRLFSTGTILYGAETPFKAVVETYEDALSHLRRMKAVGAFSVKSYNQQRRDSRQMIIKAARELQMMVVPEGDRSFT